MAKKAVFGIAKSESQAIADSRSSESGRLHENDVSVLFPDKQGPRISLTSNTPRLPRARRLAAAAARYWAERWAGWSGSERWRFQDSDPLSRRVPHGGIGGRGWRRAAGGLYGSTHRHGHS